MHGGFHGGWCWRKVADLLTIEGWRVHAPSLTGMGDRAHLLSPEVTLETHVRDIVGLIEEEELQDVVLCGHSAAGIVVSVVADRVPDRIGHLIGLDATIPNDGESLMTVLGDGQGVPDIYRRQAAESGEGFRIPPSLFSAADFGVTDPDDAAWVNRRMCDHPLRAFEDRARLTGGLDRVARKTFVRCDKFPVDYGPRMVETLPALGWQIERWDEVHDAMVTAPERVRDVLVS
ncbi:alpha/beta fold hydrolase [Amycolatopsis sp. NPDC005232]|uniref:alpha/beta fold hydrolase n=1 Tax=Amycolatopsis sp. NPDC005232 TaxID=3157027 RepID=UPI0033B16266